MQFNLNKLPKLASILSPLFEIQQIQKERLWDKFLELVTLWWLAAVRNPTDLLQKK